MMWWLEGSLVSFVPMPASVYQVLPKHPNFTS
jgi:hypothetical protein